MYEVIIVGSGFGGISTAINLNKLGIDNYAMLERRAFAGGTWLQNRYPGAAVDVQSPLYSLENEPYPWSRMFAHQDELETYTNYLLNKHHLNDKIKLNSSVKKALWSGDHWLLTLESGEELQSRAIVNATGPLSTPIQPEIEGIGNYEGSTFHCNDWPKDIDLTNKTVAIVGSGASAIQIIPAICSKVKHLHVFQRTPHWVLPRPDFKFPSWIQKILKFKFIYGILKYIIYFILELRVLAFKYSRTALKLVGEIPAKRHLKKQVNDSDLRTKLTPDFIIGCKRILVSDTYFPALQRPNVTLHDKSEPILKFTQTGIQTAKGEVEADVVVFATGYSAQDSMVSYHVVGRHESSLATQWQAYPRAYLGITLPNFPNFFVVTGPNTGIGHTSAIFVIESQMRYIMQCIRQLQTTAKTIEPTEYAEDAYTRMIHKEMEKTVWHYGGCNSWYQNSSGKVIAMYPGFSFVYRYLCKNFKLNNHIIESK